MDKNGIHAVENFSLLSKVRRQPTTSLLLKRDKYTRKISNYRTIFYYHVSWAVTVLDLLTALPQIALDGSKSNALIKVVASCSIIT